jgi:NADH-quinone oxidoreductase subunit J
LLAVLEVIIYAGAIMVLFLFIIMMIRMESVKRPFREYLRQWLPAFILGALSLVAATILIGAAPSGRTLLKPAMATPLAFGRFLFQTYWFPVEIVSLLLFVALVGALYLGRQERQPKE